jgi:hypothetical protein
MDGYIKILIGISLWLLRYLKVCEVFRYVVCMYPAGYVSESREGCPSVYDASIFLRCPCSDFVCANC